MQGVRVLLRQTQMARRCAKAATFRPAVVVAASRMFSAVPSQIPVLEEPTPSDCDFIRDAIKKLTQKEEAGIKRPPVSDEELTKHLVLFQSLVKEAHLCIADCEDCASAEIRDEESQAAAIAVEQAFSAYIDLLDDFRRASDEQLKHFSEERMQSAALIKQLRSELHKLHSGTRA